MCRDDADIEAMTLIIGKMVSAATSFLCRSAILPTCVGFRILPWPGSNPGGVLRTL